MQKKDGGRKYIKKRGEWVRKKKKGMKKKANKALMEWEKENETET